MTKLHVAISISAALCASPALAKQNWWPLEDHQHACVPGGYTPASKYEYGKNRGDEAEIIDKGDEVDVVLQGRIFTWTYYRTEAACIKANQTEIDAHKADVAAKAKVDKFLEKYR